MGKQCSIEGCERAVQCRGWCGKHYQKWFRLGDPLAGYDRSHDAKNKGEKCSVEDCEKDAHSRGYCRKHYARVDKYGDPHMVKSAKHGGGEACHFDECVKTAVARGFCPGHYIQVRSKSELEHLLPEDARAERCLAPACEDPQYAAGLCRNHHASWLHSGEAWARGEDITLPDPPTFGGRILLERVRQGLSVEDVASRVQLTRERVRQIELTDRPHIHNVKKFADALGLSVDTLIQDYDLTPVYRQPKRAGKRGRPSTAGLKSRLDLLEEQIETLVDAKAGDRNGGQVE